MIVDIHAHIVDVLYLEELNSTLKLETQHTTDGKTLYRHNGFTVAWSREDMFNIPARLREMDRKGIDMRVLSLSTPEVYLWPQAIQERLSRHINDALARICRAYPDRFVAFASLPLGNVEAALTELDRAVGQLGMKGVQIGSNINGVPLDDSRFEPLWQRINNLRLPVFEHPMFPKDTSDLGRFELPLRVGLVFDTTLAATRLIYSGIFERYPDFPYIMAHTGGALLMLLERLDNGYRLFPDCRQYISKLPSEYAARLYYDTTTFGGNALKLALATVGAQQILFGTDDPFILSDTSHVKKLNMSSSEEKAVFGDNATRLLGLT